MRLLNCETLELEEFIGENVPTYAILSHTWENEEITFQEVSSGSQRFKEKKAYFKISKACHTALEQGLSYLWVDTCCIDKSSSAELSEAINSMFKWYDGICNRVVIWEVDFDIPG